MNTQRGNVSAEWIIATAVLVIALFVPVDGDKSAFALFLDGARNFHEHISYMLSFP